MATEVRTSFYLPMCPQFVYLSLARLILAKHRRLVMVENKITLLTTLVIIALVSLSFNTISSTFFLIHDFLCDLIKSGEVPTCCCTVVQAVPLLKTHSSSLGFFLLLDLCL